MLAQLSDGFTLVGVLAGGLPAAVNITRNLFNGNKIPSRNVLSLVIATIVAVGLGYGIVSR